MNSDLLTLVYIVKNEIHNLPKSINRMKNLGCRIIVLDTGSTDGTKEWAQSVPSIDSVFDFEWADNFSEARNKAIEYCTSKFILMLDADEFIEERNFTSLNSVLQNNHVSGFVFNIVNFLESPFWVKSPKVLHGKAIRLFRNDSTIRYDGKRVHESLLGITDSVQVPYQINHLQYKSNSVRRSKSEYYRKLISQDADGRETIIDYIHLANTYREEARIYNDKNAAAAAVMCLNKAIEIHGSPAAILMAEIKSLKEYIHG